MINGVPFTATYDNQDRVLTYAGKTYTHTADGYVGLVTYPDTTTQQYVFDALGNFRTVKLRNNQTEFYQHDGRYRLVSMFLGSTVQYRRIYAEDDRIVARVNNSGVLQESYVYGARNTPEYFYKSSGQHRVITDHLGSVRLVVNTANGTVVQRMDYNEWGDVLNDTSPGFQPYGFAGGIYLPASRMVKFGARIYDASIGRWLTKDPIGFGGGDTNLYGYVMQDPVNFVDPSGLKTTVHLYPGAGGFNHIGISVGNQPSIGNYPGGFFYDQIDQGKTPIKSVTLDTTPEQEAAIQRSLNQGQGYGLVTNNCAQTVNQALCDGGATCAPRYSPTTIFPNNYINFLGGR